jgi:hypothetical protein
LTFTGGGGAAASMYYYYTGFIYELKENSLGSRKLTWDATVFII